MTAPATEPGGPSEPPAGWWRRNGPALLGLIALAPLAALAASFRYRDVYLPNTPSRVLRATGPSHRYLGEIRAGAQRIPRDVTITVSAIGSAPAVRGAPPPPGAALWELQLELAAGPEVPLDGCTLELVDADGRRYGTAGGRRAAPGHRAPVRVRCVPEATPGPVLDLEGRPSRPAEDRPPAWPVAAVFALPEGATPVAVRVAWETPDVVELPLIR